MKTKLSLNALLLLFMVFNFNYGQDRLVDRDRGGLEKNSIMRSWYDFLFFDSEEPLKITLCLDLQEFLKSRDQGQSADAFFACVNHQGDSVSRQIQVTTWDGSRKRYCDLPPLMLIFNEETEYARNDPVQHGIRLVTCCKSEPQYERYVLLEYLAYRLYNQVTPYSFQTRLAHITYIDMQQPDVAFSSYGFLIEDEHEVAARNRAFVLINSYVDPQQLNKDHMIRTSVFNYMIGNAGWSVAAGCNELILQCREFTYENLVPVASDFDFASLFKACYGAPSSLLPVETASERTYTGLCASQDDYREIIDEFGKLQGGLYKTVRNFDLLTDHEKTQVKTFLEGYFRKAKDPATLIMDFNATCRKL